MRTELYVVVRTYGMWRVKAALLVMRWVRPRRLAGRLACWVTEDL